MLYQETFRLWQLHKKSHRSIRSLVAQSRFQVKKTKLKSNVEVFLRSSRFSSVEQTATFGFVITRHRTSRFTSDHRRSIEFISTWNTFEQRFGVDFDLRSDFWNKSSRKIQSEKLKLKFVEIRHVFFFNFSKGIFKRNQTFLDQCLEELVNEHHLTSINELLQLTKRPNRSTVSIPRYVRINLLKTTSKKVRRKLKELSYRRLKVK